MALKTKSMLVLVLLAATVATISTAAIAQSSTNGSEEFGPTNESVVAQVDRLTVVTDYYLEDDTLYIELYSTGGNTLSVTETTSDGGATQVAVTEETVPRGRYTMSVDVIETGSPSVLITTRLSLQEQRGTKISVSESSLIPGGPYDGSDVRDVGIGSALGVSIGVLYSAVRAKLGAAERGERMA